MSDDFEVNPRGYAEEIRLSRELSNAIEQNLTQWGQVVPHDVYSAYLKLKKHYQVQIEQGMQ